MTARQHTVIAVILVLTGLYLMRLSGAEIQPWDEGLYAVRAQSILEFDAWWDQSDHALGGLYSATAPPFVVWLVALSMSILGPTAIAVRLPIVLCSAIALWMLYLVARRMVTYEHSILAVCVMAGTMHWALYARQSMTEVPLMMWCLVALWSTLVWREREDAWWPLIFLVPLLIAQRNRFAPFIRAAGALAIAFAVAIPWYAMMASKHSTSFLSGVPLSHILTTVEGNASSLGPLFYVNQLAVGNAVIVLAFIFLAVAIVKRVLLPKFSQQAQTSVLMWFVVVLLIFSFGATKNIHYAVMLVPAGVLLAIYAAERMLLLASSRTVVASYGIVSAIAIWALLPAAHRQSFRTSPFDTLVLVEGILIVLIAGSGFLLPKKSTQKLALQMFKPVLYGVAGLFLVRTASIIIPGSENEVRGARAVATELLDTTTRSFTYLYHKRSDGDSLNPQLAWYLNGWMAGWTRGRTYKPVAMPEDAVTNVVSALGLQGLSVYIVYLHAAQPNTVRLLDKVRIALAPGYDSKEYDDYTLFKRRK